MSKRLAHLAGRCGRLGALGLVASAMLLTACRGNRSDQPPVHLQQNMDFQHRGEAQEHSPFFADGRWMRPPVPGTVARDHLKEDDHFWRGRLPGGKLADSLPSGVELDESLLARGEDRYNIYCQPCHGAMGYGDGPVTRRGGGFQGAKPANFHIKRLAPVPLGYLYLVIKEGKSTMLGYAAQIPARDRWAIAAWVRTLQVAHRADPADFPKGTEITRAVQ